MVFENNESDDSEKEPYDEDGFYGAEAGVHSESEAVREAEYYGTINSSSAASSDRRAPVHLWLISYADFMTILLIFFLSMYAYTYMAKVSLLNTKSMKISYQALSDRIQRMKGHLGNNIEIINSVDKVTLQLKDNILFESGRVEVTPLAQRTLDELANSIKLVDGDVIVQGHTDNVPIVGGRYKSNWELSAARAFSVVEELTRAGLPPERLSAWGFGDNRPLVENDKEEGRSRNRRIEMIILKKKEAAAKKPGSFDEGIRGERVATLGLGG